MTVENIIILTDIFGKTSAITDFAKLIGAIKIIDPYQGSLMDFDDEAQAYQYFVDNIGMDAYFAQVNNEISELCKSCTLVGFSVGASVAWRLSASYDGKQINKAICYYGSQIRYWLDVMPAFPIQLILPKFERHFSVEELANALDNKPLVSLQKTDYLHGFMNKLSANFDAIGYQKHLNQLLKLKTLTTLEEQ